MPENTPSCLKRIVSYWFGSAAMLIFVSVASATNPTDDHGKPIKITTHISKAPISKQLVNSDDFAIVVKLQNTSEKEVTVTPFLSVELLDAKGQPVKMSKSIGRNGFRRTDSALEEISFVSIAAGKTHEIKVNLKQYVNDPMRIIGWRINETGDYQLKMRFQFDRENTKKTLGKGCLTIDEPEQPWNQALEIDETFMVKFKVK